MTPLVRRFARSRTPDIPPVRIAYLEKGHPHPLEPSFVAIPGIWEPAERARPLLEALEGHALAVSLRGRGESDTPATGYDLAHHVGDLEGVVEAAGVRKMVLLGFSRGVGYALGFARRHRELLAGLVLVDARPRHSILPPGRADLWKAHRVEGRPVTDFIRPEALEGMEREAREVIFWDDLPGFAMPVLVLQGTSPTRTPPSNLDDADAARYGELLPRGEVERFENSGHLIPDDEPERYRATICRFVAHCRDRIAGSAHLPAGMGVFPTG